MVVMARKNRLVHSHIPINEVIKMTIYSNLQQNVSKFRKLQDEYWGDLPVKLSSFQQDLIDYLGVEEKWLYTKKDKKVPVTVFGRITSESVEPVAHFLLDKDEENHALEFGVLVHLSKNGSEIVDDALMFACNIFKKDGTYFVTVTDQVIECQLSNDRLSFNAVFDFIVERLYMYMDPSPFE